MSTDSNSSSRRPWRTLTLLALFLSAAALTAEGALSARSDFLMRGISADLPEPIPQGGARIGINTALERYTDDELTEALDEIQTAGIGYIKQPFYFRESFDWEKADRLIEAVSDRGLILVPLLDGDPETGFSPPDDLTGYDEWVGEFARRYGDRLSHYIIWDEPNLSSHWGGEAVNPNDYAALLAVAAGAIRAADPEATIIAGPLAPTTETGPQNLSETLFLQALYEAGAADSFDVVAAKPYGFDAPPDDRAVDQEKLNFSRVILLREVLEAHNDGDKAVWAGNWGWNSLPPGWSGRPSIWGQTAEDQRAVWTVASLERARREWPWMGVMFLENWEPAGPEDDPRWGFSIAGRPTAAALAEYLASQPPELAMPGFHPANPNSPDQQFEGAWEFSPDFGADIGQTGDRVRLTFWGTDVGLRVRRADFRARFYATVDGEPANALPIDENGAALVLTSADPAEDFITTEWVARGLEPGVHVLEIEASRGWDQWALNGFSVGYRPPDFLRPWRTTLFIGLAVIFFGLALISARQADWGAVARSAAQTFTRLSDRGQMALTAGASALVALTGWLTWGQDALGVYRRLGDSTQIFATAAAATVFYVTPTFVVYIAALAVLFFLLVLRPAWGVALIALTMPFYVPPLPKPMLGYRFSPVEIFTLLATAALITRAAMDAGLTARTRRLNLVRPRLIRADWAVIAFAAVATVSLLITARRDVAMNEWRVVIIEPVLFYFLLRAARLSRREMWVVLDAFVLSGVIIAAYGLWQYATGQNLITAEGGLMRLRSIYGSPNNVALYLDRLLPLLVAMLFLGTEAAHGKRRWLYAGAILPVGLALLLTFSKGALFLGVPASLLIIFWIGQGQAGRRIRRGVMAAIVVGLTALVVATQVPSLAARLNFIGETGFLRLNLWRAAANMFVDHPWLGVGLDNFLYEYRGRYILDAAWQEPNLNHPHNILLDFATRLGLLGLLAGGWMIWETAFALYRAIKRVNAEWLPVAAGLAGSLAAMLAHGLVDHSFFLTDLAFAFFLMLGLAVWLAYTDRHQPINTPSSG